MAGIDEPIQQENDLMENKDGTNDDEHIHGQVMEDACHNIIDDDQQRDQDAEIEPRVSVASEAIGVTTRSGRSTSKYDYKSLDSRGTTQFSQLAKKIVKQAVKLENRGIPAKKLKRKKKEKMRMFKDTHRKLIGIMMSQLSQDSKYAQVGMKKGLKRYGRKGIEALLKEFAQLNNMDAFSPMKEHELSKEEKSMVLNLLALLKEKRCGKIKGRVVADGRKQRMYVPREEASSPTIQLESLIMSLTIDAKEDRDVATADIAGAYLLAEMKDKVIVKLKGEAVDIMCSTNKRYEEYVNTEKGKKVLYLKLRRALYGCIQSALLWYKTFATKLIGEGFKLNKYDPCVANKLINGKQCTICWYVDDTKISHEDPKVADSVIKMIEDRFGKMTVKRAKQHTFVGMDFDLTTHGKVKIHMKEYIKECIEVYDDGIIKTARTPASHDLFIIKKDNKELGKHKSEVITL